jgi:probable O-glycosylation ligase (exosortase A-associated)
MRIAFLFVVYFSSAFYSLINPALGLLFFVHITIFRPEQLVWGNPEFGRLHLTTSILVLLGYLLHKNEESSAVDPGFQNRNLFWVIAFSAWLFLASMGAEVSRQASLDKAIDIAKIALLCFLFTKLINSRERLTLYVWVASVSLGLLSFWGILQGMAGNFRLDTLWPGGSNYGAAQLALLAPVAVAKALDPKLAPKLKLLFLGCALAIVLCCVYTDSRGGFLGVAVALTVFFFRSQQRTKILVAVLVIFMLALPWIPQSYSERISSIFVSDDQRDASSKARFMLWQIAIRIWEDHPVAGVGLENFSDVKEQYRARVQDLVQPPFMNYMIFERKRYVHGMFVGLLAEAGLIGTGLLLILLLRNSLAGFPGSFSKSPETRDLYLVGRGAQAGLIGFTVAAVFGDFQYIELLYLQMFFVGAIRGYAERWVAAEAPQRQRAMEPLVMPILGQRQQIAD